MLAFWIVGTKLSFTNHPLANIQACKHYLPFILRKAIAQSFVYQGCIWNSQAILRAVPKKPQAIVLDTAGRTIR